MKKSLFAAALLAAAALALTGCGSDKSADKSESPAGGEAATGVTPVVDGKFTVCTNPPYAPFEDVQGGQVVGFDIDLMGEVAKDLGLELSPRETGFEAIESGAALNVGDCDAGASGLTITDDRKAKLDFSDSYYETTMGMLVKGDSTIKDLADLKDQPVAVQQGTTGEEWAHAQAELTQIRQFEGLGDQMAALKAGEVVAVFNDVPTLTPYEAEGFVMAKDFATGEQFGFAVKKGNTALLDQVNQTLKRVHDDGTYDQLVEEWFAAQ
jgi:polar amino acid transport system substrate-binding protein